MPRELMHWYVLEDSLEHAPPTIKDCIRENFSVACLGACAHDIGYFHTYGPGSLGMLAELLHGAEGEDTNEPLLFLLNKFRTEKEKAFIYGMFSHAVVDRAFHPAVYYLTGDYYAVELKEQHEAQAAHRLFEVYLDSWVSSQKAVLIDEEKFAQAKPVAVKIIGALAEQYKFGGEVEATKAVGEYLFFRRVFLSKAMGASFRALNFLSLRSLAGFDSLFTYGRGQVPESLEGPLNYKNPVSGEEQSDSLEELSQQATEGLSEVWRTLASDPPALGEGASLNFNLHGATKSQAQFFSSNKLV